jgi:hypothetical protein
MNSSPPISSKPEKATSITVDQEKEDKTAQPYAKSHKPDEKAKKKKNAAESRQRNLPTNNHFGHKAGSLGPTKLRRRLTGRSSATRAMLVLSQLANTY